MPAPAGVSYQHCPPHQPQSQSLSHPRGGLWTLRRRRRARPPVLFMIPARCVAELGVLRQHKKALFVFFGCRLSHTTCKPVIFFGPVPPFPPRPPFREWPPLQLCLRCVLLCPAHTPVVAVLSSRCSSSTRVQPSGDEHRARGPLSSPSPFETRCECALVSAASGRRALACSAPAAVWPPTHATQTHKTHPRTTPTHHKTFVALNLSTFLPPFLPCQAIPGRPCGVFNQSSSTLWKLKRGWSVVGAELPSLRRLCAQRPPRMRAAPRALRSSSKPGVLSRQRPLLRDTVES